MAFDIDDRVHSFIDPAPVAFGRSNRDIADFWNLAILLCSQQYWNIPTGFHDLGVSEMYPHLLKGRELEPTTFNFARWLPQQRPN